MCGGCGQWIPHELRCGCVWCVRCNGYTCVCVHGADVRALDSGFCMSRCVWYVRCEGCIHVCVHGADVRALDRRFCMSYWTYMKLYVLCTTNTWSFLRPRKLPQSNSWRVAAWPNSNLHTVLTYHRDWLIGVFAYRLQWQENMCLLYVCAY